MAAATAGLVTGFTFDGSATLVDLPAPTLGLDRPAATVLPDQSLIVAATVEASTTVWHLSATLDILGSTTTPGGNPILAATPDGALLITADGATGYARTVTAGPTLGPPQAFGAPIDTFAFGSHELLTCAPWVDGDNIYILTRNNLDILTTTGSRVAHHTTPEMLPTTAHPHGDHALVMDSQGQVWRVGYDGTVTTAGTAGISLADWWPISATDPAVTGWRLNAASNTGPAASAMTNGGSGVETYASGDWRSWTGSHTADNQGGALSITTWIPASTSSTRALYVDHLTPTGVSHARIDTGGYDELAGGSVIIAQRLGRWVAAAVTFGPLPGSSIRRLLVHTGTVPYHEGILAVDTLDHPWWIVGTRDPNMVYELLISTPLGWKVEIVAGEEHLATDELCVYDPMHEEAGDDGWVVCALFRPE